MPAGPGTGYEERSLTQEYRTPNDPEVNGDESAASILQSVKEQVSVYYVVAVLLLESLKLINKTFLWITVRN